MRQDAAFIDVIARDAGLAFRMRQLGLSRTEQVRKQARNYGVNLNRSHVSVKSLQMQ